MVKWLAELRLGLAVTTDAKLRLTLFEKSNCRDTGILDRGLADLGDRTWHVVLEFAM